MTLAEQIRPLLASPDPRAVEGAAEIAAKYAAECRAINDRLARCSDYLRRGLRCEAVHLAETQPNVLQAAEDWQAPDSLELERLYHSLGLPVPERPGSALLDELRSACEVEQSLASLMSMHRMLAVGRGPIRQRLAILYELDKRDPQPLTWQSDIRLLEAQRAKGIEREYKIAIRDSDLEALERLGDEVQNTPWRKPLPRELTQQIQKSVHTVRRDARIAALQQAMTGLLTAREAGDLDECARLLDQWQTLTIPADVRTLDIPPDLLARGSAIMQSNGTWLTRKSE